MPILDVEFVAAVRPAPELARRIADAAAGVFGAGPHSVWVKLRWLGPEDYDENGGAVDRPVFVRVLKRSWSPDSARDEHARLAQAIAAAVGVEPGNVHVTYEPPAAGRQSFGGALVD
jgi:phenylpyruvate tautomerase PptA (4-oxalocrotonate tautomerase family)